jgi:hypothetical protein
VEICPMGYGVEGRRKTSKDFDMKGQPNRVKRGYYDFAVQS